MERWRRFLKAFGPRGEWNSFYPDGLEARGPVLLNDGRLLSAAFTATRVLHAIALRRGTPVQPATLERLEGVLARGLSEEVRHHCEAEAEEILAWIETPPVLDVPLSERGTANELEMMVGADLESRLAVARFAREEGYDLELEYYDRDRDRWPRVQAELIEIQDEEAADFQTALILEDTHGRLEVPLKYVRWLMPVEASIIEEVAAPPMGDVIPFRPRGTSDAGSD